MDYLHDQYLSKQFIVKFIPSGRGKAQCEPDPNYPNGIELDLARGLPSCNIKLQYPAPECGTFIVKCLACGLNIGVTAAGRVDDPTKVNIPCSIRN